MLPGQSNSQEIPVTWTINGHFKIEISLYGDFNYAHARAAGKAILATEQVGLQVIGFSALLVE